MKSLRLQSFRLKNFKAVRDSGIIEFTPLTIFIGNNGSGKSSIIEGIKTFQDVSGHDLEEVMQGWHGYENIWHKGVPHKLIPQKKNGSAREHFSEPMIFELTGRYTYGPYSAKMEISLGREGKELFISKEEVSVGKSFKLIRDAFGHVKVTGRTPSEFGRIKLQNDIHIGDGVSIIGDIPYLDKITSDWQFLYLDPVAMGEPAPQYRTGGKVDLLEDGANIAEYLKDIRDSDQSAFQGIVETLQYVLPYVQDLQPKLISALDRNFILQVTESDFEVAGWLLSTGTLRFLGILALLRHPKPPSLILVEELENGLDPRTLNLVIDEIRNALEAGKTQIIATTHSPYLLDLLHLSQIVLVERLDGQPTFIRPDEEYLQEWSKKFSPGQLYTMDILSRKNNS